MRFAILGAGAVGAYVGATLARAGLDVTVVARGDHLRAMQRDGIRVLSPLGDFDAHPPATSDIDAITHADVVFSGLKSYSLSALAPRIGRALGPSAALIAAQNGVPWWYFHRYEGPMAGATLESVDPGGAIAHAVPIETVVGCVVSCSSQIVAPGLIRHVTGTSFAIGEPDGEVTDRCRAISAAFTTAGLTCPIETQIRNQIWAKLVGNAAFNPVSAMTRAELDELGSNPEIVECAPRGAMRKETKY